MLLILWTNSLSVISNFSSISEKFITKLSRGTVDKDTLEIQSGVATERVEAAAGYGKLIVMVPFIGVLAEVVGL